mmetsp:Transcript_11988/g.18382  ORF Transcript_11988/g.18382 Transcript_11988/m.18382 type:complete len:220 (-) Transcript_11988:2267-2926(-)
MRYLKLVPGLPVVRISSWISELSAIHQYCSRAIGLTETCFHLSILQANARCGAISEGRNCSLVNGSCRSDTKILYRFRYIESIGSVFLSSGDRTAHAFVYTKGTFCETMVLFVVPIEEVKLRSIFRWTVCKASVKKLAGTGCFRSFVSFQEIGEIIFPEQCSTSVRELEQTEAPFICCKRLFKILLFFQKGSIVQDMGWCRNFPFQCTIIGIFCCLNRS